jgi:hypothetical protein
VRKAIDSATGEEVPATRDAVRRAYGCPNCGKRVKLRSGSLRVYFAHQNGVADEACDLYVSPRVTYTGRRYARPASGGARSFLGSDHLAFGVGLFGPQLALFLPPADQKESWAGSLRFTSDRISRTYRCQHLRQGQSCQFPLVQGSWSVVPEGDVAEEYVERIQVGSQSLAEGQSLFDASRDLGRQILPGESVYGGDSLWWLSRHRVRIPVNLSALATFEQEIIANDWFIFKIALSTILTMGWQRDSLASWLQRPVRPRRARVWIEEPWTWGHTVLGIPILDVTSGDVTVRSEQPADIAVRSVETGEVLVSVEMASELSWTEVQEGYWEIVVNGLPRELFQVSKVAQLPANILARIDEGAQIDWFAAQSELEKADLANRARCDVELTWGDRGVADLIELNGKRVTVDTDGVGSWSLKRGDKLSIDRLGEIFRAPLLSQKRRPAEPVEPILQRARWLLGVSAVGEQVAPERIRVPSDWQDDEVIRQLKGARWRSSLAPQVRELQRLLERQ